MRRPLAKNKKKDNPDEEKNNNTENRKKLNNNGNGNSGNKNKIVMRNLLWHKHMLAFPTHRLPLTHFPPPSRKSKVISSALSSRLPFSRSLILFGLLCCFICFFFNNFFTFFFCLLRINNFCCCYFFFSSPSPSRCNTIHMLVGTLYICFCFLSFF